MRCPACNADNLDEAPSCATCGGRLPRRARRRDPAGAGNATMPAGTRANHQLARIAYRCSVLGLIPLVGLLLGPAALVLGIVAWCRSEADVREDNPGRAIAAVVFGAAVSITNWVGVLLMWHGLANP